MQYKKLAELYEALSATTKRLEKIDMLSKFLKELKEEDKEVLYLLIGRIYPEYSEKKIGISNQLTIKSLSRATGINDKEIVKEWKKLGDLGEVAEQLKTKKRQSTLHAHAGLNAKKVLDNLRKLPELEGKGTINKKIILIVELLSSASAIEAKYLIRTLIGDLRVGIQDSTIRDSLAKAFFPDNMKEAAKNIELALDKSNDLAVVFDIAKKKKIKSFGKVGIEIGKPLKVMLAQKAKDIAEGFEQLGKPCVIEYKYDGFRMLIHKKGNELALFTRRLENITKQFPEVVDYIQNYVKGKNFILDSEAVGYHKKTKEYTPFQSISQRIRRKYNIEKMQKELPVEINVFDILYYDSKSLLNEPFKDRTKLLKKIIKKRPYKIITAKQIITSDESKAKDFYKSALKANQEGIMMKNPNSIYQPGKRVGHMLKVKPEEKELDLVIVGAEYGTGKRKGVLSSFILACNVGGRASGGGKEKFLEIGKMSTGVKEKTEGVTYEQLTKMLKPLIEKEHGRIVKIKPKIVISVTYQEIQHSPNYKSSFALRFPRFKALRPDRSANDCSTLNEIKKDYERQKRNWKYG